MYTQSTMATNSDFQFSHDGQFQVSQEMKEAFKDNGFIFLRNLLSQEEVQKLKGALESEDGVMKHVYGRDDGAGRKTKSVLWNQPGSDITGVASRTEKIAGTMEQLLGGEVYHYHSKVIMKDPHTGGAHVWHQDYGYWYLNGCLFPDMGTVWMAVDKATQDNGCLKVVPGSHKLGRIEHGHVGDQAGADLERVELATKQLGLVHCEMEPGDALFFHCNVLHRSDQNNSPNRRWGFLCCYNRASNNPVYEHHHPCYSKLDKVPDSAIMECANLTDTSGKDFFSLSQDFSIKQIDKPEAGK
ncbi:unnamed protein product [Owenia fusiformis]|uniref:Uncharacterized protein n=1 Tax=Owenia fusiformis TaxID=6347 RepID=A0A8J1UUF7_OWEFU|nr:unnamed protein product [Owenia fusiformis]